MKFWLPPYREFAFPAALSDRKHEPFFSVEEPTEWITSHGYQLFLLDETASSEHVADADLSTRELKGYRNCMVTKKYVEHPFFSMDNTDAWIAPAAFQAYVAANPGLFERYRSRAPSRAASSISCAPSRASSRASFVPSSRASSPVSFAASDIGSSRPPSAMSLDNAEDFANLGDDDPEMPTEAAQKPTLPPASKPPAAQSVSNAQITKSRGKAKAKPEFNIQLTREHSVNEIIDSSTIPPTFPVQRPDNPTALRLDLTDSQKLLTKNGKVRPLASYILSEDRESWSGSNGHAAGDVQVFGLTDDLDQQILCRRADYKCNGLNVCPHFDESLFGECERYEVDEKGTLEVWERELDENVYEAARPLGPIARFYCRVMNYSKCKRSAKNCDGIPMLDPSKHGKKSFVGCSKWSAVNRSDHFSHSIPPNVDEESFKFAMENHGLLPGDPVTVNDHCVLTVHPRLGVQNCVYTHVVDGRIINSKLRKRPCQTRMTIFTPVEKLDIVEFKALVVVKTAHNHPAHPKTKPTAEDRLKLEEAIQAAGLTGLTARKLLIAPTTATVYAGRTIAEHSPAFTDNRKIRDFITDQKKVQHPFGLEFEGVCFEMRRQVERPMATRYIHTAIEKNGFRLIVTMHPYIATLIHEVLSLSIDYTFKRIKGTLDEWEVVGFSDRFKERLTFASLYCDKQTRQAFAQLFTELFDTVQQVTGEPLKLAPFFPTAKCRAIILDGEVPQAQGFADFLAKYNDPEISGIHSRDREELLGGSLKTCGPHFERNVDELPNDIPIPTIARLKSIVGLQSQSEIECWHKFCAAQDHPAIQNWYQHKLANPWILPSINKFLSKMSPDDWDITPSHSNYVESAHAGRNAATGTGVPILTGILQSHGSDDVIAERLAQMTRSQSRKARV
ncbi:hypothetical protein DFH06DRAFT_1332120 [Mycena polygramma]|nr:hypothetical protein DFH06DRAFT_1332120 [Mycena polygramma]